MSTTKDTLHSGRIDFVGTATSPIHHGAGSDGNRQILRKQPIIHPETGRRHRVPFISGNSFKHMIRAGAARFAIGAMGVTPGSLSKGEVHLLFSGGALSGGGATIKLARVRVLERLFPVVSMCGYSAGNNMTASKLSCDHIHLVCAENAWRLPAHLRSHPHASMRVGEFIGDDFGTRHEPTRADHTARRLLKAEALASDLAELERAAAKAAKGGKGKTKDTAQMYFTFEAVLPGAQWCGGVYYDDLTTLEIAALKSGLAMMAKGVDEGKPKIHVGAKASTGYGRITAEFTGSVRKLDFPRYEPSNLPIPSRDAALDELGAYVAHLKENRDDILKALKEATS